MVRHELGKWNLDELAKNPNRKIIDKKLIKIESNAKRFEKIKKSLNPKISSGKFLKLLHDIENITEKSICFFHQRSKNSNRFSMSEPNLLIRVNNDVASSDCVFSE